MNFEHVTSLILDARAKQIDEEIMANMAYPTIVKITGRVLGMCHYGNGLVVATEDGVFSIRTTIDLDTGREDYAVTTIMFRDEGKHGT